MVSYFWIIDDLDAGVLSDLANFILMLQQLSGQQITYS